MRSRAGARGRDSRRSINFPMSSTAGGKLSRSASAIIADTACGYHILRIDGYSRTKETPTGEYIKSRPFTVGGHRWCIRYYPNGNASDSAGQGIKLLGAAEATI